MRQHFRLNFILIVWVLVLFAGGVRAQSACDKVLIAAENLYQSGQLYAIPERLQDCLEKGFNFQEKQSAYRLLTLTYLNINQEEKAKDVFHKLLKLNPDYLVTKEQDPIELYNLYLQFNVDPIAFMGIRGGGIVTEPFVLHQRSSSSLASGPDKFYRPFYGFGLGGDFALPLHKNLLLELSPSYVRKNYLFYSFYLTDSFNENSDVPQVQEVQGGENYQQLVFPLILNFRIPNKKKNLFYNLGIGGGFSWLLSSSYQHVSRTNRQIFTEEISLEKIESTPFRRQSNVFGKMELGMEYKYLGFFWGARAGLSASVFNFTRYANQQEMLLNTMSTTFGWLEDDFVLANGHLSFFVRKPLYKFLKTVKE